jgi:hypothetical protein
LSCIQRHMEPYCFLNLSSNEYPLCCCLVVSGIAYYLPCDKKTFPHMTFGWNLFSGFWFITIPINTLLIPSLSVYSISIHKPKPKIPKWFLNKFVWRTSKQCNGWVGNPHFVLSSWHLLLKPQMHVSSLNRNQIENCRKA